jgi:DNA-binding phage protein
MSFDDDEPRGAKRWVEMYEGPILSWGVLQDRIAFVAVNVREIAAEKDLRLSDVAADAGLSERTIYNLLAGKADPRLSTLLVLAWALDVGLEDLLVSPLSRRSRSRRL